MFEQLSGKLRNTIKALSGKGHLTESNITEALREVRIALLEADVSLEVTREFITKVRQRAVGREVMGSLQPGEAVIKVVQEELTSLLGGSNDTLNLAVRPPAVIFVAGLQGAGKTTTVGKLGKFLNTREKKSVLLVSTDVRRPAAIEQLAVLAENLKLSFFPADPSCSPVDIARDALLEARRKAVDVVIVDTAGRLHIDQDMMKEVRELHHAVKPVETLFVVDSMTGQDAVNSAQAFNQALPLTGIVLTKTDGDARGGAALSIRQVTGKPIKFLGVGEDMDALEAFHPDRITSRILGMGDVLSLVEEIESKIDRSKAEKLAKKITRGKSFDLDDLKEQLIQMRQMGGMQSLMEKMPGTESMLNSVAQRKLLDQYPRMLAIIYSMTPHERRFPSVIRGHRMKRIAVGSGTKVQDVSRMLKEFHKMQKLFLRMRTKGRMEKFMGKAGRRFDNLQS